MIDMQDETGVARVLLIADDPLVRGRYSRELESNGYIVRHAPSFGETLLSPMADLDVIVLCDLAVMAHPGQSTHVVRISEGTAPAALVREVHRRIALRTTLSALAARAA
jgi:DNA-binding NarL/FixJ family response regulator